MKDCTEKSRRKVLRFLFPLRNSNPQGRDNGENGYLPPTRGRGGFYSFRVANSSFPSAQGIGSTQPFPLPLEGFLRMLRAEPRSGNQGILWLLLGGGASLGCKCNRGKHFGKTVFQCESQPWASGKFS